MMFLQVQKDLKKLANPEKAKIFGRFFKTGKGEYGEGDKFLGIMTGSLGELAGKYPDLSFQDLQKLLDGQYHEERSLGIQILLKQFAKGDKEKKDQLRRIMWENVSIKRTPRGLKRALEAITQMLAGEVGRLLRLRLLTALSIVVSAQKRSESIGVHFITQES